VGFEPTTPVFERVKIVHALDRAVTVISSCDNVRINFGFISNSIEEKEHYYDYIFVTSYCNLKSFGLQPQRTFIRRRLLRLLSSIQRDTPEGDTANTTPLRFLLSPNRLQGHLFRGWWSRGPRVLFLYQPDHRNHYSVSVSNSICLKLYDLTHMYVCYSAGLFNVIANAEIFSFTGLQRIHYVNNCILAGTV
jgi:hypothetical protein